MIQRGRSSGAELAVVPTGPFPLIERPEPPVGMSEFQQNEWRRVVSGMPADWFRPETLASLAEYCSHMETAEYLERRLRQAQAEMVDTKELKAIVSMRKETSAIINALMRSMRLTQQATFDKERKKDKLGKKPWQQ
jgi:hypothetical protein